MKCRGLLSSSTGYKCESQHDERDKHSKYGCSCWTVRGEKAGVKERFHENIYLSAKFKSCLQTVALEHP